MRFSVFSQLCIFCDIFAAVKAQILAAPFKWNYRGVVEYNLEVPTSPHRGRLGSRQFPRFITCKEIGPL